MSNTIQLQAESVFQIPLAKYDKDFTFIINCQEFHTTSIFADLLSPIISARHFREPTMSEFSINTRNKGDFNTIINLMTFNEQTIKNDEIPFIIEILESLGTNKICIKLAPEEEKELTTHNIVRKLEEHQRHPQFFKKQLDREITYFSEHFYELDEQINELISHIFESEKEEEKEEANSIFEYIINNPKLQLESEDQLLFTINKLYMKSRKYSYLYKYVDFVNALLPSINEFIEIFDIENLTHDTWKSIVEVLQRNKEHQTNLNVKSKHEIKNKIKIYKSFEPRGNEFDGIANYYQTQSNIKDEINITASSNGGYDISRVFQFDNNYIFQTKDEPNSWVCFEFKNHPIILSNYLIKSCNSEDNYHLKSWDVEGSNDNKTWITLDEQRNNSILKGAGKVHLFEIQKDKMNEGPFKFIRIRQTGPNWYSNNSANVLLITSIEFYGQLI